MFPFIHFPFYRKKNWRKTVNDDQGHLFTAVIEQGGESHSQTVPSFNGSGGIPNHSPLAPDDHEFVAIPEQETPNDCQSQTVPSFNGGIPNHLPSASDDHDHIVHTPKQQIPNNDSQACLVPGTSYTPTTVY